MSSRLLICLGASNRRGGFVVARSRSLHSLLCLALAHTASPVVSLTRSIELACCHLRRPGVMEAGQCSASRSGLPKPVWAAEKVFFSATLTADLSVPGWSSTSAGLHPVGQVAKLLCHRIPVGWISRWRRVPEISGRGHDRARFVSRARRPATSGCPSPGLNTTSRI